MITNRGARVYEFIIKFTGLDLVMINNIALIAKGENTMAITLIGGT